MSGAQADPQAPPPPAALRTAAAWAEVYRLLDYDSLPESGHITSLDQLVVRPAAYWQDWWLPHYQGPDDVVTVQEFEQRLGAALRSHEQTKATAPQPINAE